MRKQRQNYEERMEKRHQMQDQWRGAARASVNPIPNPCPSLSSFPDKPNHTIPRPFRGLSRAANHNQIEPKIFIRVYPVHLRSSPVKVGQTSFSSQAGVWNPCKGFKTNGLQNKHVGLLKGLLT
jgi:hypothetical protein